MKCPCISWAREASNILTQHHPDCEHYAEEIYKIAVQAFSEISEVERLAIMQSYGVVRFEDFISIGANSLQTIPEKKVDKFVNSLFAEGPIIVRGIAAFPQSRIMSCAFCSFHKQTLISCSLGKRESKHKHFCTHPEVKPDELSLYLREGEHGREMDDSLKTPEWCPIKDKVREL